MIKQHTFVTPTTLNTADLDAIRRSAKKNSPEALRQAAEQFEALFMNMVLKSMRKITFESGLFNNNQSRMYTSMLDQELSQVFAKRGIGLADALMRQLQNNQGGISSKATTAEERGVETSANSASRAQQLAATLNQALMISSLMQNSNNDSSGSDALSSMLGTYQTQYRVAASDRNYQNLIDSIKGRQEELRAIQEQLQSQSVTTNSGSRPTHVRSFIDDMMPYAQEASRETGIPANFMIAQAALETGWGQKGIVMADGTPSYNLFGIKAGSSWGGKVANSMTTEYENGVAVKKNEPFRAYNSYAESFRDYARLISNNPRYSQVLENGHDAVGFAQGLQEAGYATDPQYAAKLTSIIQRSIQA